MPVAKKKSTLNPFTEGIPPHPYTTDYRRPLTV